jgi:hypothetical protein
VLAWAKQPNLAGQPTVLLGRADYLHKTRGAVRCWIVAHPVEADRLLGDPDYRAAFFPASVAAGTTNTSRMKEQIAEEAERYHRLARVSHGARFTPEGAPVCEPERGDLAAQVWREFTATTNPAADNGE